ncbi:MAG: type II and III secretion system protein family protein [Kiloniellales bacterium]
MQVKSPRLFYVFGLRSGETTLYAVDEQDQVLLNRRVSVSHNLSRLQSSLAAMLPQADIKVRSVEGSVVLSGTVATAADSETARRLAGELVAEEADVINRLSVAAPSQINLGVRVAEVKRDVLKQLGVNWTTTTTLGDWTFGLLTGNLSVATSRFTGTHTRTLSDGSTTASLFFDALETEGLLTILAEPNLTAISGETATFLAGGEFPIAVPGEDGSNTVEFRQFGVSLAFTPTLVSQDRISLRVRPEVSAIDRTTEVIICTGCTAVPGLTTRRAETTVELGSGQSFMIAGLLRNDTGHNLSKFPWLGDIPILGALFRSDSFQRNETELLIVVTPFIVRPVSTRLALPTDGYVPPNDFQRYIRNRRYVEQLPEILPVPRDRDGAALVGPAGFVLE